MVELREYNGITGATIYGPVKRSSLKTGAELALQLLSVHVVEFDKIVSIKNANCQVYTIRHTDGTYLPIEVKMEVLKKK